MRVELHLESLDNKAKLVLSCCLFFVTGSVVPVPVGVAQQEIERRCAQEIQDIPFDGYFWAFTQPAPESTRYTTLSRISHNNQDNLFTIPAGEILASNTTLLDNGHAVAFMTRQKGATELATATNYRTNTLNVATSAGLVAKVPSPASMTFWSIGPELAPGHVGVLAFDNERNLIVVDIPWMDENPEVKVAFYLPFTISEDLLSLQSAESYFAGDNWDLVFHQNDYIFEVYSTADEQILWQVGYFPDIPLVESVVAEEDLLVLMHGLDNGAKGELIAIDWNGEVLTVIDLTTILGEDARIHLISSVNKARQVVLWVVSDPLSHQDPNNTLVLLNLDTLELVDFCLPLERIGNVRWVGTGETLLIQEPPSTMTLLSIDTGDYRHLDTYFDPVGWIDDNDN